MTDHVGKFCFHFQMVYAIQQLAFGNLPLA